MASLRLAHSAPRLAFGLALLASLGGCKDDPHPTEVRLSITSLVDVDELEVFVRTRDYEWDKIPLSVADRDLRTEAARILFTPGRISGEFLVYARGFLDGVYIAGNSLTTGYKKNTIVRVELVLDPEFVASDADEDGFVRCGASMDQDSCDCDDRDPLVNPFGKEICGDSIDNDCSGGYPPDGSGCPCTEDIPCTNLDADYVAFAGVGACTLGVLRCVDGVLSGTCEGASPIRNPGQVTEMPNNFIDDDCDGAVDEGSPCTPSDFPDGRICHRGFVDDAANDSVDPLFTDLLADIEEAGQQASFLARGECAPSGMPPGRQLCDPASGTWAAVCSGDILPQRPPFPGQLDGLNSGDRVDPATFVGVGFQELRLPGLNDQEGLPIDQCDGRDNDCDGVYDEAPAFDSDGDGYTRCGTPVEFVDDGNGGTVAVRDVEGLEDRFIDCDDGDSEVNPGATEICGDEIDQDCACDHGDTETVGQPRFKVDGTFNCTAAQAFLNCALTGPRSDPTVSSVCNDTSDGEPIYYYGYRVGSSGVANGREACFTCPAIYGLSCSADGDCSTKAEDCTQCPSVPEPPEPSAWDPSQVRPLCGAPTETSCTGNTAAIFEPVSGGDEYVNSAGSEVDECQGFACEGWFWGKDPSTGACYTIRDARDEEVGCAGKGFCQSGDTPGSCCDPADPASCCEDPALICQTFVPASQDPADLNAALSFRDAQPFPGRPTCTVTREGTCFAETGPTYDLQGTGDDLFNDCQMSYTCAPDYYFGLVADEAAGGQPRCYFKAAVSDNACDGTGACQSREQACLAQTAASATSVNRAANVCKIPTSGCSGMTPPTYGQNVAFRTDPYNDCGANAGAATCCNGACCQQRGQSCSATNQCDAGLSCVDGVCCQSACDGACEGCANALTGQADGTCAPINTVRIDDSPVSNLCTASGGACLNPPCICDGGGDCLGDIGATCAEDTECARGNCVDGVCCESACTGSCDACSNALTGAQDGRCRDRALAGPDTNPPNACENNSGCGSSGTGCSCNASGACLRGQGSTCSAANQCLSGNCVDGVCCDSACTGPCKACTAALSTSSQNGVCANIAALSTDTSPTTTCGGSTGCSGSDCVCQPGTGSCLDRAGTCATAADCPGDFCVENQCCDSACNGVCESCLAALTASADGVCAPIDVSPPAPDSQPATLCTGSEGCAGDNCACQPNTASCLGDRGSTCTSDSQCILGNCVDGVCCESACNAACDACSSALTGAADGFCRDILASGTPDNDPAGACTGTSACDGSGNCERIQGQSCSSNGQCLSSRCVDGRCCENSCDTPCRACSNSLTGAPDGECRVINTETTDTSPSDLCVGTTGCGGNGCTCEAGSGLCKESTGSACSSNGECLSSNCVDGFCCNSLCAGACDACDVSGSEGTCTNVAKGTQGSPSCSGSLLCDGSSASCPADCNGDDSLCETGFYCTGSNTCASKQGNGATCSRGGECSSNNCIDGRCCNSTCGGACNACDVTGSEGTCTEIPDGEEGEPQCAGNLRCDGISSSCPANCVVDLDCDTGYYCDGSNACRTLVVQGDPCTTNSECATGFCADGACCDTACTGQCESCTSVLKGGGSNGVCGASANSSDPDDECGNYWCQGGSCDTSCAPNDDALCKDDAFCDGAGNTCVSDLLQGDSCDEDQDCLSGSCVDGVCCESACSGTCQACSDLLTGAGDGFCRNVTQDTDPDSECGAYFCVSGSCETECGINDDNRCKSGFYCEEISGAGQCRALQNRGEACEKSTDCSGGDTCYCPDGSTDNCAGDVGVCCDAICGGDCESCFAADTASSDGTCAPIEDGSDPLDACSDSAGTGLACDGAGASCPASCATLTNTCEVGGVGQGVACSGGFYCNDVTGLCEPELAQGAPFDAGCGASAGVSCDSGFAVDGVCCDTACSAQCEACTNALTGATTGTCAAINDGETDTTSGAECLADGTGCAAGACACDKETQSCLADTGESCGAGSDCWSGDCSGAGPTCQAP